jgi:(p)ppGpp synthase/HD superfamily hydrolase
LGAFDTMVKAQGLRDADRQASWHEEGDRGTGAPLILHRIRVDGIAFRWSRDQATAAA